MNYYEHHIGDYDKNTAHLSACEDGIYCRLLRRYYDKEAALEADVEKIKRWARARTEDEREAVEAVLAEFFHLEEDGWHHDKADGVIAAYQAGQPEREAKKRNEETRMERHRRERAELFSLLNSVGEHLPYNVPMADLRARVQALRVAGRVTGAVSGDAGSPNENGKPATPATQPATALATPATATQTPDTRHQTPDTNLFLVQSTQAPTPTGEAGARQHQSPADAPTPAPAPTPPGPPAPLPPAPLPPAPAPPAPRAVRKCPATFKVNGDLVTWANKEAPLLDLPNLKRETAMFRDHTFPRAITDWAATWRNWIRRAQKDAEARAKRDGTGETAYQRSMRNRMAEASGGLLADHDDTIRVTPIEGNADDALTLPD